MSLEHHQQQPNEQTPPPCCNNSRRMFLKTAFVGLGALWTGLAVSPVVQYLASSGGTEEQEQVHSVALGQVDDMPFGTAKNFKFGSQPAIIYRDAQGNFHAYSAVCTHLGCTVQYKQDKQKIYCACHGGTYDPETGKNLAGPPPKPLSALVVAVVNNQIVVSRA